MSEKKKAKNSRKKKHGKTYKYNETDDRLSKNQFCYYVVGNHLRDENEMLENPPSEVEELDGTMYSVNKKEGWKIEEMAEKGEILLAEHSSRCQFGTYKRHIFLRKKNGKKVQFAAIEKLLEKDRKEGTKKFQEMHGEEFFEKVTTCEHIYVVHTAPKAMFKQGRWNRGDIQWTRGDEATDAKRRRRKVKKEIRDFFK